MRNLIFIAVIALAASLGGWYVFDAREGAPPAPSAEAPAAEAETETKFDIPVRKLLTGGTHVWQTFNNCSSVALVIVLSYIGINDTQEAIAEATRPWRNQKGDNDDKSVTLYELERYAKKYGLATYVRPNGDIEKAKKFIANGIPVLARARMYPGKDFVHYRVLRGYDDEQKIVIESDGITGNDVRFSYGDWMHLWEKFNYSYLIVVPLSKQALVEKILGEDKDERVAWENALERAEAALEKNPDDYTAGYNAITAMYHLGDHRGVVRAFEKIEPKLSEVMLWYQPEPIYSYFELGEYDRVIQLADSVINNNNKSVSELYILKGKVYEERGDLAAAKAEFEKALYYNKNLPEAREALRSIQ